MENFKSYIIETQKEQVQTSVLSYLFLMENIEQISQVDNLNESDIISLEEGFGDFLAKLGLKAHKGKGLIDYAKQFAKGAGKLIIAATQGDKKKVKEIANSIEKEDVINFIMQLDQATLHIITGPLHFIDAVTGWHIGANLKHAGTKVKDILKQIWEYLTALKSKIPQIFDTEKEQKLLGHLQDIENSLPIPA